MNFEFFRYDFKSRLKQPMVYIFFVLTFSLVFAANVSSDITIGGSSKNTFFNSSFAISQLVTFMGLLGMFMTVAFTNSAALRDFDRKFDQILFAAPIQKGAYLFGRYLSSLVLALFPILAVFTAIYLATFFSETDQVGPNYISSFASAFFLFGLPNLILTSSLLYVLVVKTRSGGFGFAGAMLLCIGYLMSMGFLDSLENEWLIYLLDPFGNSILNMETKYWTIEDLNTLNIPISSGLLLNRGFWMLLSVGLLFYVYKTFSFKKDKKLKKKKIKAGRSPQMSEVQSNQIEITLVKTQEGPRIQVKQLWIQFQLESKSLIRSTAFRLLALFGILNTAASITSTDVWFGTGNLPVSFVMTDAIQNSLYLFIIIIIGYFTGQLVWAERKAQMDEIIDASPQANWVPLLSKFLVISRAVLVLMIINILFAMVVQLMKGYTNLEPMIYFIEIIALDLPYFMLITALGLLVHVLVNRQYIGFFVFLLLVVAQLFVWPIFEIDSNLLTFGGRPNHIYSDLSGWKPFAKGLVGYTIYWSLVGSILLLVGTFFWVRGRPTGFTDRINIFKLRFNGHPAMLGLLLLLMTGGTGCILYYQSDILNENLSSSEQVNRSVAYESKYKQYESQAQPKISSSSYDISLYPEIRGFEAKGNWWIINKSNELIQEVHFTKPGLFEVEIEIPGGTITLDDEKLDYLVFQLSQPLEKGDSTQVLITSKYFAEGIENDLALPNLTQNGIFLNNKQFMPTIGYDANRELQSKDKRQENGLAEHSGKPSLKDASSFDFHSNYLGADADWVNIKTIVSTSKNQTAIAPGSLIRSWTEGDRKFYEYQLEKKVMNFFAVLSAEYEIQSETVNGVTYEVYYHPAHDYNVDKMLSSMKNAIGYYSKSFSPYPFKQARIIEFPRFAEFAQAFPGTMPYSESIGFLADLKDPEDIDGVTYVVAHEMGHQWWAHQLVGADIQGAEMLSETLAQYSALMVMERTYGAESMQKFLKYEMDKYLRTRSRLREEPTLMNVDGESPVFYNKGSVAMFALKEYIGADSINVALQRFIEEFAYNSGEYPTSLDFLRHIKAVTPDSLSYLVSDFFEHITLYDNQVEMAECHERVDGKYAVTVEFKTNKFHSTG
ncbi:MAG: hypothetical protein HRT74_06300, partial [Flavobacteriales bacterium]|nr:hypothetical protein [Flavobacteriales bacterium]